MNSPGRKARTFGVFVAAGIALFFAAGGRACGPQRPAGAFQRGVALGLFASDPAWDYGVLLREIAATGATDVELAVELEQADLAASVIAPSPGRSPSPETLVRTIRQAHGRGLRVLLLPLLRVAEQGPGVWRGRIVQAGPAQADAWWDSYTRQLEALATIAARERVERLAVGAELLGLESERARWQALIARVRARFPRPGRLLYSANWDHYRAVSFWDLVDEVGVTAYAELAGPKGAAGLARAWQPWLAGLSQFAAELGRSVVITEVGYLSRQGTTAAPWDETLRSPVDPEEQRLAYQVFTATVGRARFVSGVYFWNWFGFGGPRDGDYTPRGKPAARVMEAYFNGDIND